MYGRGLKQDFNDVLCVREALNSPINLGTEERPFIKTNEYFNIHWFEFCMTHLVNKVFHNSMNYTYITEQHESLITGLLRKDLHPIDYLYAEFKNLKIKK
jgi:hypothetical protein